MELVRVSLINRLERVASIPGLLAPRRHSPANK